MFHFSRSAWHIIMEGMNLHQFASDFEALNKLVSEDLAVSSGSRPNLANRSDLSGVSRQRATAESDSLHARFRNRLVAFLSWVIRLLFDSLATVSPRASTTTLQPRVLTLVTVIYLRAPFVFSGQNAHYMRILSYFCFYE